MGWRASASSKIVVAIDGPSGVGKSVTAVRLAQALGFHYAQSGAMYRAVGWLVESHAVPQRDGGGIAALVAETRIDIALRPGQSAVWVNGRDISEELVGEAVGRAASAVATLPVVRQTVTARLRRLRCHGSLVMEGRDIGTVVFPDADAKFFLDASLDVRAWRRWQEMRRAGHDDTLEEVRQAIAARDKQDRTRALAPLVPAADAHVIDTADFSIDGIVQTMVSETQHIILRGNG
jgi:cytidylate kinase